MIMTDQQTLIKISSNILSNSTEPKFRELKAANQGIKSKVLDVKSGHEYLILVCPPSPFFPCLFFETSHIPWIPFIIIEIGMCSVPELRSWRRILVSGLTPA
jgi:hypothetical protein